ncbi:hypothetical protein V6N11_073732 [Hibiscus sabdariffa]|uniref:Uncharacterized protein n=2 Tax=Hibiscus sabdariffa TaxID=183260 RepID=A0ABR2ASK7_9ROSI
MKTEQLWVQVLHAKYKCFDPISVSISSRGCSRLWHGLNLVWNRVNQGIVWNLGNGDSIDFWDDPWLVDIGLLIEFVSDCVAANIIPCSVASMVGIDGEWKWNLFDDLLLAHVLLWIVAVKLPLRSTFVDHPR